MATAFVKKPTVVHNFIRRVGNTLYDGVTEYRFSGANIGWLGIDFVPGGGFAPPPTSTLRIPSEFRVNDVMATVKLMGGNVIRMNPNVGGVGYANSLYPSLGVFNEINFAHLDYVIATARNYGIRLIFPFVDHNEGYYWGSKASFAKWGGTNFYTDSVAINNFKYFIESVITRENTVNGLAYKDDPAILGWETVNEGNPPHAWTAEIAAFIKGVDSKHLVFDGKYATGFGGIDADSLTDDNIDVVTDHYYPMSTTALTTILATENLSNRVFAVTEYDWPSTRGSGVTLSTFLASLESHSEIKGSVYWNLSSHDDYHGWAGYVNDYAIACPENTGLDLEYGRASTQTKANALRTHAFRFRQAPITAYETPGTPTITGSTGNLQWQGVVGAVYYQIQRSTTGPSSGFSVVTSTVTDANSPWVDPAFPGGDVWYRIAAINANAVMGGFSSGVQIAMNLWWVTSGVTNCDMAFAAKGAVDYTASKMNLASPGTHDLTEGLAPAWYTSSGWVGNGSSKYLLCDYIPASQNETWIIKFSNYNEDGDYRAFGIVEAVGQGLSILPRYTDGNTYYDNGNYASVSRSRPTSGVMAIAGNKAYVDGVDESVTIGAWGSSFTHGIALLARWNTGADAPESFFKGNISSFCHYPSVLTESQIQAIGAQMP